MPGHAVGEGASWGQDSDRRPLRPRSARSLRAGSCLLWAALQLSRHVADAAALQPLWLISILPYSGKIWDAGLSIRIGAQIILEEINRHPALLPGYELKVIWQDSHCNNARGTQQFLENIFEKKYSVIAPGLPNSRLDVDGDGTITAEDLALLEGVWNTTEVSPDPIALFGTGCSGVCLDVVPICHAAKMPMVSPTATRPSLSDRKRFPSFFRTQMPDTAFCKPWLKMAKFLGHASLVTVIAEASDWRSMGTALGQAAVEQGVEMAGHDLTHEIAGFHGLQITLDSAASAAGIAAELLRLKRRVVILIMYEPRARLVLCAAYRQGFMSALYMPLGWLSTGWWTTADTSCTPAEITQSVAGFINVKLLAVRTDDETRLGCSDSMTVRQFVAEVGRREINASAEGYIPFPDSAFSSDGLCVLAMMLHQMLVNEGIPLSEMITRTQRSFDASQRILAATDFEGVQAKLTFEGADPLSSVIIQQMQPGGMVDIATYSHPNFVFLGKGNLTFNFPGENFFAGPAGTSTFPAHLDHYVSCPSGKLTHLGSNTCRDCPQNMEFVQAAGRCLCVAGYVATPSGCSPCDAGFFSDVSGTLECSECPVGKSSDPAATECTNCARGFYAERTGSSACTRCPALQTTQEIGSTRVDQCVCDSGAYRMVNGQACKACPANASTIGIANTDFLACRCKKGMYMSATLGRCVTCPRDSSTEEEGKTSVQSCLCKDGLYMPLGAAACASCPPGMRCPKGSNEANFKYLGQANLGPEQQVLGLQTRFWASREAPMAVFDCRDAARCPGGVPGNACVARLGSMCCQHCASGYHWDGSECTECKGLENFGYIMVTLLLVLGPIVIAVLYKTSGDEFIKWGSRNNTLNVLGFVTLNHYQIIDLIVSGAIILPQSFTNGFDNVKWTNDPYRLIQPGCIGVADLTVAMSVKALAPVAVGLVCVLTACLSVVASRVLRRPELKMTRDRLFNIFGSVMFTFFGAIANMSMSLFKCNTNPSGVYTLSMDLSVICFSSAQWRSMLGISIVCVLIYILGLGSLLLRAIIVAPAYFQDHGFQVRWKFLFIKFHSGAYWWGVAYLARNTILQLIFVLTSTGGAQVYCALAGLMIYLGAVVAFMPFRAIVVNFVDTIASAAVIYLAALLVWFAPGRAEDGTSHESDIAAVAGVFIAMPLVFAIGGVLYLLAYGRKGDVASDAMRSKAEHDFREIRESARALADMPSETGCDMLLWLGDWERFYLTKSSTILRTDLLGNCSKSRIANHDVPNRITDSIMHCRSNSFRSTLRHKRSLELEAVGDEGGGAEQTPGGSDQNHFEDLHADEPQSPGLVSDSGSTEFGQRADGNPQPGAGKHIQVHVAPDEERKASPSIQDPKFSLPKIVVVEPGPDERARSPKLSPPKIVVVEPGPDEACVDELGSFLSRH